MTAKKILERIRRARAILEGVSWIGDNGVRLIPKISPPSPQRSPVCVRNAQAGKELPTLIKPEEPSG